VLMLTRLTVSNLIRKKDGFLNVPSTGPSNHERTVSSAGSRSWYEEGSTAC